jgi:hypothetical protein
MIEEGIEIDPDHQLQNVESSNLVQGLNARGPRLEIVRCSQSGVMHRAWHDGL